ncbi:carcinoembryonic antigen-related cell adhesion molecule 6-like [Osmerus mordax]|uniref:carcinoembryonic antigen-related cell adhesion molecule 6-like n=1 Tax=Osmerus mordax TaxID=8014 RepID=UPI00350FF6B5
MDPKLLATTLLLFTSGMCTGENVLPEGPLSGAAGGAVRFTTVLAPPAKPFISVSWRFKGASIITSTSTDVIDPLYSKRITLERATGSLELRDLGPGDSGEYRVTIVLDGAQDQQGISTLSVFERISGAIIKSPPGALLAGRDSTNLTCAAAGSISTREWMKDGGPLSPSDRVIFSGDNSTVSISPVRSTDNGEYLCRLSNPISAITASQHLTVNFGPQNVSIEGKSPAFAGQKVTLSCFAFSVPPAIFTWRFNGNETDVNDTMYIIDKIEDTHTGNYTCMASNYVTGLNDSAILSLRVYNAAPSWSFGVRVTRALLVVGLLSVSSL